MLFSQILIPSALVPLVVALAVAGLGILIWGRDTEEPNRGNTLGGLALGAAFIGAYLAMTGPPRWFPVEASQRLFFLMSLAAMWSVAAVRFEQRMATVAGHAVLWGLALPGLLETPLKHSWSTTQAAIWLSGLAALAAVLSWAWAKHFDHEDHDITSGILRVVLLSGIALALGLSGTARMAQLCGALAAGIFAVETLSWWQGRNLWRSQQGIVPALGTAGLILIGHFYAELAALPAALLVAASALLGLRSEGQPTPWPVKLIPLIPLIAALVLVIAAFMDQPEDPYDYYSRLELPYCADKAPQPKEDCFEQFRRREPDVTDWDLHGRHTVPLDSDSLNHSPLSPGSRPLAGRT